MSTATVATSAVLQPLGLLDRLAGRVVIMRLDEVKELGYSDEFIRLWNYYLCYCEAAFEERYVGVLQVQFDKPQCVRDPIVLSRHSSAARAFPQAAQPSAQPSRNRMLCGEGGRR